jgi:hypothetical protein
LAIILKQSKTFLASAMGLQFPTSARLRELSDTEMERPESSLLGGTLHQGPSWFGQVSKVINAELSAEWLPAYK